MFDQKTFKETLLESVKNLVDSNVIIGQSIISGDITVIPVFKASIGVVEGGSIPSRSSLGGGAAGISVTPVTFIVIENNMVKILSAGDTSTVERVIEAVPGLIDKIAALLSPENSKDKPADEQASKNAS
ncbi:MAG: hypothetical protein LBK66_13540 [Spirochaetaceae bacterium]|nr:hypothetical protein [Spirochaetaceae bacterium]